MAPSPIRIAILEADTPIGKTLLKYGSYGGVFTSLLHRAADASNIPRERLKLTGWDVVNMEEKKEEEDHDNDDDIGGGGGEWEIERRKGYPALEDVDAVLITGSRFNAFDDDPWIVRLVAFVRRVLDQERVKIIGVCYGHQIVARALGARVGRSEGGEWEVSVCKVDQTEEGRGVFGGGDTLSIFQMHRDCVYTLPPSVLPLGSSPLCSLQGLHLPDRLVTVQGHPEFDKEIVTELLERRREQGIFDQRVYEESMGRVGEEHDGVVVARGFLRFLGG